MVFVRSSSHCSAPSSLSTSRRHRWSGVAPGTPAVLLLDRAGWHATGEIKIPKNITLVFLTSRAPELSPAEKLWQCLRQTYFSNRVFETYEGIIEAACEACNRLLTSLGGFMSIGLRDRAHQGRSPRPLVQLAMRRPNQDSSPLRQPNLLPSSASERCYPGNLAWTRSRVGLRQQNFAIGAALDLSMWPVDSSQCTK